MVKVTKRSKAIVAKIDKTKSYTLAEAIDILKETSKVKFVETLEIAIQLGVDPRHSDQMVRGVVNLPKGTGKKIVVAVFAKDAKAAEATVAGADIVGSDDLISQIEEGRINFDRCIATPDMMALIGRVAKILGPKGLMPNPKLGTVTMNVIEAVKAVKAGQIEFKVEKAGIVHVGVGKLNFETKDLEENIKILISALNKAKPVGAKGQYLLVAFVSSTMGAGLRLNLASII